MSSPKQKNKIVKGWVLVNSDGMFMKFTTMVTKSLIQFYNNSESVKCVPANIIYSLPLTKKTK